MKTDTNIDTDTYINSIVGKIDLNALPKHKSDGRCAPGLKYEAGSCARLSVLIELAKAYNYSAPIKDKIRMADSFETLNPQKYKAYLVYEINKRVGDRCTSQKCWSKQDFIRNMESKAKEEFIKHTFRPDSPQGRFEWLSTFNINDAVAQYYREDKGGKFFGAIPMDFAELGLEVANIKYDDIAKQGLTKLGVVFNLDNHDQPGSHWTAMYTDLDKGNIFYFDSFGKKPEQRVRSLMRQQARYLESTGKPIDSIRADYNRIQHQFGDSECGVYSINFLIRMMRGDDFDKLCNTPISDKHINKCRAVYFDKHTVSKN